MTNPTPKNSRPTIRNQQVDGSSPFAGSIESTTYSRTAGQSRWQGAYQGAYRLISSFRRRPVDALPTADDVRGERAYQELARRLRG